MNSKDDRLLTYTEAAYVLGYKSYSSLLTLVEQGYLKTYSLTKNSRKRVKLSSVMNLATVIIPVDGSSKTQICS